MRTIIEMLMQFIVCIGIIACGVVFVWAVWG